MYGKSNRSLSLLTIGVAEKFRALYMTSYVRRAWGAVTPATRAPEHSRGVPSYDPSSLALQPIVLG